MLRAEGLEATKSEYFQYCVVLLLAQAVSSSRAFSWLGAMARQVLILFTLLYIQYCSVWQVVELEVKNLVIGKSIGETELKEGAL